MDLHDTHVVMHKIYIHLHTNTSWDCDPFASSSLQWWLQWQAPWMRVSATWAQRATRRMICRMRIEMSKTCCPAVAKNCRWDPWAIGFVNSERSEKHKTAWRTAQRHCPAPAKSCHLSTCGRQISPLQTRKRHRDAQGVDPCENTLTVPRIYLIFVGVQSPASKPVDEIEQYQTILKHPIISRICGRFSHYTWRVCRFHFSSKASRSMLSPSQSRGQLSKARKHQWMVQGRYDFFTVFEK